MYILTTLSKGPVTGYGIMQRIEDRTEGAWRPGPGTIYPLLKCLVSEKLVTPSHKESKTSRVSYTMTPAGERELVAMRTEMGSFGRKDRVIVQLASDLIPSRILVPVLLNRARDGGEFLRAKIAELPEPDRTAAFRELGTITENQLDWIRSNRQPKGTVRSPRRRIR